MIDRERIYAAFPPAIWGDYAELIWEHENNKEGTKQ